MHFCQWRFVALHRKLGAVLDSRYVCGLAKWFGDEPMYVYSPGYNPIDVMVLITCWCPELNEILIRVLIKALVYSVMYCPCTSMSYMHF